MGRNKKMTAKRLRELVDAYFDSIRTERTVMRRVPELQKDENGVMRPVLDEFGHERHIYEPVILADGTEAVEEIWMRPPSWVALSLFLGVDRSTLFRWKTLSESKEEPTKEDEEFCNIVTRAWGRIEAYLSEQTEDPKKARGAIANLEANFGWKRRKEVGLDAPTARVVGRAAAMSSTEKLDELKKLGLALPWMDEETEETNDDDE